MDQKKVTPQSKESVTHKAGDKLERLGEKITRSGANKTGKFVYDVGDRIEHLTDKKH